MSAFMFNWLVYIRPTAIFSSPKSLKIRGTLSKLLINLRGRQISKGNKKIIILVCVAHFELQLQFHLFKQWSIPSRPYEKSVLCTFKCVLFAWFLDFKEALSDNFSTQDTPYHWKTKTNINLPCVPFIFNCSLCLHNF